MQSRLLGVSFLFLLCALVIGCGQQGANGSFTSEPSTFPVTAIPSPTQNVVSRWLIENESCVATCWNNITIPQSWEQGYSLLQKEDSIILGSSEEGMINNQIQGVIGWQSITDSIIEGEVFYKGDPRQIYLVAINPHETVSLQNIIDILGEPTHIYAFANDCFDIDCINSGLTIVYLDKGIALDGHILSLPSGEAKFLFNGDWRSFSLLFFEPSENGLGAALTRGHTTNLDVFQPWRGLLPFQEYCQGDACDLIK